jgi:hypothetical protein
LAGRAPLMPGQNEADRYYSGRTTNGLRAVWMAQSDPASLSLMAFQLAGSSTLSSLNADAVQRAVVHFATQP